MVRNLCFTSLIASSAMALVMATPAHADKRDRAEQAIAAAEAKLHTADTLGAGVEVPAATAAARASLLRAKEDLKSGHKSVSIDEAIHAQALADTAIGELQRRKDASLAAAHEAQRETVAAAHDQAASAQQQAVTAQQQAATAQQQAAEANARAEAAEQAAASSAADAAAARAAAAAQPPPPPQVETTVTTHHGATHHSTKTHVTRHTATPSDQVTTTTTVTQH
jgi:hypothetical protein